jgi:hypothetical protein
MDLLNLFVLLVEKSGATPAINGVRRAMNEFDMVGAAQTFVNGIISQVNHGYKLILIIFAHRVLMNWNRSLLFLVDTDCMPLP